MQISRYNRRHKPSHQPMAEINMVPYLDVLLVLLVIFMVTVPIFHQGVKVDLPKTSAKKLPTTKDKPLIVSLDKRGRYTIENGEKIESVFDQTKFLDRMKMISKEREKTKQDIQVFIKADKHLAYGEVLKLMDSLQQIDITKVGLVTQPLAPHELKLNFK